MEVESFCCYISLLTYFDRFVEYLGVSTCCKYMCVCMYVCVEHLSTHLPLSIHLIACVNCRGYFIKNLSNVFQIVKNHF